MHVGGTTASEMPAQPAPQPLSVAEIRPEGDVPLSADAVAEARWARSPEEFVLNAGGTITPREAAPEIIGPIATSASGPSIERSQFDSDLRRNASKCGPSPATPAEIRRLVVEAAQRHNVDVGFAIAVVTAESRLDRLRNSPKGARGPMQLMPETAERFGVTDICDPGENIDAGVRYLRELGSEFRNPLLVAAAYNAGEGRVRQHGGLPPFKETLGYVAEVLNIQMGLEGTGPHMADQTQATDGQSQPSDMSGVITSRERRQWVGGVMHF